MDLVMGIMTICGLTMKLSKCMPRYVAGTRVKALLLCIFRAISFLEFSEKSGMFIAYPKCMQNIQNFIYFSVILTYHF